jgi:flagellar biosynthesis/type III secretory pathway protein FliH
MTLEKKSKEDMKIIALKWLETPEGLLVLLSEYDKGYEAGVKDAEDGVLSAYDGGYEDGYNEGLDVGYEDGLSTLDPS